MNAMKLEEIAKMLNLVLSEPDEKGMRGFLERIVQKMEKTVGERVPGNVRKH
jgi:hypothetical protein|tara:strand:+ start:367 stop:522 length:156 start_codon:yes stop_codon:yes gene_type:complete